MTIKEYQAALAALGFNPGPIDGFKGDRTTAAIKAFQSKFGLYVDGIVGPQTSTAIARALAPAVPGRVEPDKSAMRAPVPVAAPAGGVSAPPPNTVALLSTSRAISEIVWHCAATPEGKDYTIADIRAWHKQRGFSDIGYHYVVYRDGRVMPGRPIGQVGAHVEGRNVGTIGCSYIGGLAADGKTAKDTRTTAQRASMLWLTEALVGKHRGVRKVSGHNEYAAKACPSFDVRRDALSRLLS